MPSNKRGDYQRGRGVLALRFLPGFALQKNGTPLQGYIYHNTGSRGVAPCYNMSPFQGFNIVIPAQAGISYPPIVV
ncbi:MAG: hypothetical protein ACR2P4_02865 [Gammaproteobacteria bacterium]